jgi:deoxycytidylate deaminase
MSNPKHTPGPWGWYYGGCLIGTASNGQPHHITKCEAISNSADSRLIAAAPELLAALETVVRRIDADEVDRDLRAELVALIAKATGGSK